MKIAMRLGRVYELVLRMLVLRMLVLRMFVLRIFVPCAFIFGTVVSSGRVMASAVELDLAPFAKGTHLITLGRYDQAAEQWHRLSLAFLSAEAQLGRKKMWQYAGMSAALAAMAADNANSALAYQYWADSTRYLMTGGTDWSQVQKKMHRRFEQANTLLSTQVQVADVVSSVDHAWQQELSLLQVWDEKLSLFHFASPKLGLSETGSGLSPAVSLGGSENLSVQPRYIRPTASATGKKLSGINSTFSHEKRRPTTVSITGPDTLPSEALQTEKQSASTFSSTTIQKSHLSQSSGPNATQTVEPKHVQKTVLKQASQRDIAPSPNVIITPVKPIVFNESTLKPNLTSPPNANPKTTGPSSPIPRNAPPESQTPVAHTPEHQMRTAQTSLSDLASSNTVSDEAAENETAQDENVIDGESVTATEQKEVARGVVSRGNLESVEDAGVEAIRRRSFAPTNPHLTAEDDVPVIDKSVQ